MNDIAAVPEVGNSAYARTAKTHFPREDETTRACRVRVMEMRDAASLALQRCSPEASGVLSAALETASRVAFIPTDARKLMLAAAGINMAIEAARLIERAVR